MKKILLLMLLVSTPCYAGQIALGTISADATASGFNNNFTTIANVINGNIEGSTDSGASVSNIKADAVYRINMADDADPATFAKETLQITVDTVSSEGSYVYSGCVPADDTDLTSDISACVAYINGIRVTKSATTQTYTASRDTYVDLSQTGVYTLTAVANGAAEPVVAANSARLSKVVTDGTEITTITDMRNTRLPGLLVPANFRTGMQVSRDSTTTLTVFPGTVEINNTMVTKTSTTTLTISTAGDYAGGSSLRATSTYGYVGIDASGNLKLHTTAPTHSNYGVSITTGKKRYATWSSTVYRILGWFFMNATGSGELNAYEVGNIKEADVPNANIFQETNAFNTSSATFVADTNAIMRFYSSGNPVKVNYTVGTSSAAAVTGAQVSVDTVGIPSLERSAYAATTGDYADVTVQYQNNTINQGTHTIQGYLRGHGGSSVTNRGHSILVEEL